MIANPLLRRATFSELFGLLGLPPIKGTSCPCPFHEDKNPSCSVFIGSKGHEIAKCFKGCFCGDVYDMYARAFRCDRKAAFIELNHKLGIATATFQLDRPLHERFQPAPKSAPRDERIRPSLSLGLGDDRMVVDLSTLRCIHEGGVRLALERGLLGFGNYMGRPAWVMKDRSGLLMQARRLDGRTWFRDTKAITLKGSDANHLLGVQEAAEADLLFVCEGGPDMLAAHALVHEMALLKAADPLRIAVTGLMGASMRPRRATLAGLRERLTRKAAAQHIEVRNFIDGELVDISGKELVVVSKDRLVLALVEIVPIGLPRCSVPFASKDALSPLRIIERHMEAPDTCKQVDESVLILLWLSGHRLEETT